MTDYESRLTPKILQNYEDPKVNDEPKRWMAELRIQREELSARQEEPRQQHNELAGMHHALEQSRQKYFNLFDLAPVAYFTFDPHGLLLEANRAAADLLAAESRLIIRQPISRYVDEAYRSHFYQHLQTVAKTGQRQTCELKLTRKDGGQIYVHVESHAVDSPSGDDRILSVFIDITDRKKAKEELRQRVEEVEKMLAVAPVGIWMCRDAHCNVILGNRTANRYYEAADQENVSANISTRRKFFRNGRELKPEDLPMQSAAAGNIDIHNAEFDILLPSGKWRSLLGFASPLHNTQGDVRGCIGAFLDITERKAAEQQLARENREIVLVNRILRVFAEASGDALFNQVLEIVQEGLASKHGVFGYIAEPGYLICPSLSRMLDECEVAGKCIHYPPGKWKGLWARALREKRAFYTNAPSSVPAGHPAIRNNLAAPILFHGEAVGLLNLANKASDYTETDRMLLEAMAERIAPLLYAWIQKKLREDESAKAKAALRRMNETLEHQVAERTALAEARAKQLQSLAVELIEAEERERRKFAHLLHDDLQQMLAAAKMQLQAVSVNFANAPSLTVVDHILNESIAKTRHLSHELSPPVLQHFGLVAALHWLCHRMGEQFDLDVELETNTGQLLEAATLKNFLFRAVHELLFNIVKHAGVKNARIVLAGSDTDLSVVVSDHGQGFNPDILNSAIKEPGFGLMGIRERASYIGGSLTIDSAPGQGSRFTLTVPLTDSSANAAIQRFPTVNPECRTLPAVVVPASGGIRVLFADDHHVMRQGLIKLVNGQPDIHVVGQVANGQEALNQARRLRPDVVVMDVSMPLMDGVEATRRIKAELPQVRVIGLTMYEEEHIVRIMREAGAEDCISKSVSPAELLKAIYGNTRNNQEVAGSGLPI